MFVQNCMMHPHPSDAPADDDPEVAVDMTVSQIQSAVSLLLKQRLDPTTKDFVAREEGRILSSLASLQMVCEDLRLARGRRIKRHRAS